MAVPVSCGRGDILVTKEELRTHVSWPSAWAGGSTGCTLAGRSTRAFWGLQEAPIADRGARVFPEEGQSDHRGGHTAGLGEVHGEGGVCAV